MIFPSLLPFPTEFLQAALLVALILLVSKRRWLLAALRRIPAEDAGWILAWCAIGLALRVAGHSRVPGHINDHGYEYLNNLLDNGRISFRGWGGGLEFHGNGIYALHRLGLWLVPWSESGVLAIQVLLSVLSIPAMYAAARLWLGERAPGHAAMALAAVFPPFVFYALTEERLVGGVFLLLVAVVGAGAAVRDGGYRLWIVTGLFAGVAAATQPYLLMLPVLLAALLLSNAGGRRALRTRQCWSGMAAFVIVSLESVRLALHNIRDKVGPAGERQVSLSALLRVLTPDHVLGACNGMPVNTFVSPDVTPPPFGWIAIAGFLAGLWVPRRRLAVLALAASALLMTNLGAVPFRMNTARLQLPADAFWLLLEASGLGAAVQFLRSHLKLRRLAFALGALVPLASIAAWPGPIGARFTPQWELDVARDGLPALPSTAMVLVFRTPAPEFLSARREGEPRVVWRGTLSNADNVWAWVRGDAYYFREASCFDISDGEPAPGRADGMRADCAAFEKKFALTPVYLRTIPARPDYAASYLRDSMEIGYFRAAPAGS